MKLKNAALAILMAFSMIGCASKPNITDQLRAVSKDYMSNLITQDTTAYIYGDRTVIELDREYGSISVTTLDGESIPYTQYGRFFRLDKDYTEFIVNRYGGNIVFKKITTEKEETQEPTEKQVFIAQVAKEKPINPLLKKLFRHSKSQILEIKSHFQLESKNSEISGEELFKISRQIQKLENMPSEGGLAIIVYFGNGNADFKPDEELSTYLSNISNIAEYITITGYTDGNPKSKYNKIVAQNRAESAMKFFVDSGISKEKVFIGSQLDGYLIAPNNSKRRKLNRRVEIIISHNDIRRLSN